MLSMPDLVIFEHSDDLKNFSLKKTSFFMTLCYNAFIDLHSPLIILARFLMTQSAITVCGVTLSQINATTYEGVHGNIDFVITREDQDTFYIDIFNSRITKNNRSFLDSQMGQSLDAVVQCAKQYN